ncbi:MAG: glycolate oxidase subunit GlcE [Methylococcales bacterium]|jgi:glycolate oxidase FAD binding subunit|nr:glycolate oxidase subunit GlcE [Methylococcales bacterium]
MNTDDKTNDLIERSELALSNKETLYIQGSGSKSFLIPDNETNADHVLSTVEHKGIIEYDPSELVITVRSGTSLKEIEDTLKQHNQRLPFEPPHFGKNATIGGTIACGLSGPARPYFGAVRDHILGIHLINGRAKALQFGGKVMKNVAGYDCSRLQSGAKGTLGLILAASIKLLPDFPIEVTVKTDCSAKEALVFMTKLARLALPITATLHSDTTLYIRLSGYQQSIDAGLSLMNLEAPFQETDDINWLEVREHQLPIYTNSQLYRLSLPANVEACPFEVIMEWSGCLRWLCSEAHLKEAITWCEKHGGNLVCYQTGKTLTHIDPVLKNLSNNVKQAFNSQKLWNPNISI